MVQVLSQDIIIPHASGGIREIAQHASTCLGKELKTRLCILHNAQKGCIYVLSKSIWATSYMYIPLIFIFIELATAKLDPTKRQSAAFLRFLSWSILIPLVDYKFYHSDQVQLYLATLRTPFVDT
ncbi:BA75_00003T0 [Komagataella pastoris]|uniref:BA75_00003T0 n=1 Tax=Komagataella pastoris TaxID=4922 RepID=A0A1B2J6V6_PICPA|nr:BA75_00003T0 [Komagataella pastoris]